MKIKIIPVIIAEDFWAVKEKIKAVEPYTNWVQLDIMDGQFVKNFTWNNPEDLKTFKTDLSLELHLMIEKPEKQIDKWIQPGVKRIIFHYEATDKHKQLIERVKKAGLESGMALNPETPIDVLDPFLSSGSLSSILIMTVKPGKTGQEFFKGSLAKIRALRKKYREIDIGVDGGINLKTAPQVIKAGANILSVGSAIFKSKNIKEAIKKLKEL